MDQTQAVILGAQIAGGTALAVALLGFTGQAFLEWRRRKHEVLLAAKEREHARAEKRYDDLKSAYVRFAAEMRRIIQRAEAIEREHYLGGNDYTPEPEPWDTQVDAEQALADLRLLVGDELYGAGREWLDRYYQRYWWPSRKREAPDLEGAEAQFIVEAKRMLGLAG